MSAHSATTIAKNDANINVNVNVDVGREGAEGAVINSPLPALFLSHGGPTFIYENHDFGNAGAWRAVRDIGARITNEWKPDYVVVVSAHWQLEGPDVIEIAVPPKFQAGARKSDENGNENGWRENPLIYDFYGFPDHMYQEKFRTWNSPFVSKLVSQHLERSGFKVRLTERGIDHGVWVPLKVAFPEGLASTPLVQVSLTSREGDFKTHARLGEALGHLLQKELWDPVQNKPLRGLVICSGMSVHNLRDLRVAAGLGVKALPYVGKFNLLVSQAMQAGPDTLEQLERFKSEEAALLFQAHPTLEHFVPLVVAAGLNRALNNREVTELYNDNQFSLGWATFQFGVYAAA